VPSKPGYEPLYRAKSSRHPEVAGYQPDPAARPATCHVRAPPTEVTASPPQTGTWRRVRTGAIPRKAKVSARPPGRRTRAGGSAGSSSGTPAPKAGSATSKRLGSHPAGRCAEEPRSGARTVTSPQPGQDQRPGLLTRPGTSACPAALPDQTQPYDLLRSKGVSTLSIPISAREDTARPRR
jgi:hypothetical protein